MWFLLSLVSSVSYSFRRFSEKTLAQKANHFSLGFAIQAFSLPGISLLLFFTPIPNIFSLRSDFWVPLIIIWFVFYPAQAYFYYKSLKEGDVSTVIPLMSLIPIFTVVSSWILLKEIPSTFGFLGIFAIVAGVYTLNMKPKMSFIKPITHLFTDKPSLFMIISNLCLATGSTLDKIAINASNPFFYSFVNTLGATIVLFIIAAATNKTFKADIQKNAKGLIGVGILQSIAFTTFITALSSGFVSYVYAIKSSSVILSSIWGFIFLKESFDKYKLTALGFILVGLVLIAFA